MESLSQGQRDVLNTVMEIVPDTTEQVALHHLESCNWNADQAVALLFQNPAPTVAAASGDAATPLLSTGEPQREQMLPPRVGVFTGLLTGTFSVVRFLVGGVFGILNTFLFGPSGRNDTNFLAYFRQQFGEPAPEFLNTSFSQAMNKARQDAKLLVVFLHCDTAAQAREFCRDVLQNENIRELLSNFVVWGGDIMRMEPHRVAQSLGVRSYPYLSVILPVSLDDIRVVGLAQQTDLDSMVAMLTGCVERAAEHAREMGQQRSRVEEDRALLAMQDAEYEEALARDRQADAERRAKQEADREAAEAEQRRAEKAAAAAKEREERKERIDAERRALAVEIPARVEASLADAEAVRIGVRLPSGQRLDERFGADAPLQLVADWAAAAPFRGERAVEVPLRFQLVTSFPTQVLSDMSKSLRDLGLAPSAALLLKEIDEDDEA